MHKDKMLERTPDIGSMVDYWDLSDTLVDGIQAMRAAGQKFLPQFPAEDSTDYDFRLKHTTVMTNIFADIVETLASKPFEKEVALVGDSVSEQMKDFANNVDGDGNNLTVFSSNHFYNAIKSGVDWLWVDYPEVDDSVRTVADMKARNIRPYWTTVLGRNVLQCTTIFNGAERVINFIRMLEPGKPDRIREMRRDGNVVTWSLYVKTDKWNEETETHFVLEKTGTLGIDEIPLVPFFTGRRSGNSFKFDPPLKSAADLQEHLYRAETRFEHIKTVAGYPMLSASGVKPVLDAKNEPLPIKRGPNTVLYAPPNADGGHGDWKYVEPTGNNLMFLQKDIDTLILNLRELGRQPLTASSSNLTTVTTAFAAGKSKSAVKAWAMLLKDSLENAFRLTAKWMRVTETVAVNVYTEFDDFVDGKDYDALTAAFGAGAISWQTYVEELKRRGLLSSNFTVERERERLLDDIPSDDGEDLTTEGMIDA